MGVSVSSSSLSGSCVASVSVVTPNGKANKQTILWELKLSKTLRVSKICFQKDHCLHWGLQYVSPVVFVKFCLFKKIWFIFGTTVLLIACSWSFYFTDSARNCLEGHIFRSCTHDQAFTLQTLIWQTLHSPSPSCSPGFLYLCIRKTCSEIFRSLSGSIFKKKSNRCLLA